MIIENTAVHQTCHQFDISPLSRQRIAICNFSGERRSETATDRTKIMVPRNFDKMGCSFEFFAHLRLATKKLKSPEVT